MTFSPAFRFCLCIGFFAIFAACQPPPADREPERPESAIKGQVFVVLPNGESLRLGSVRVQLFEEEAIEAHLREREEEIAARRDDLRRQLSKLEKANGEGPASAEESYREREAQIQLELAEFNGEAEARTAALGRQIESNLAFIDSMDALPPPPEGIPSRKENEEYEKRRKLWLSMDPTERRGWADALTSLNLDLKAELEKIAATREEKIYAFADELRVLDEAIDASRKKAAARAEAILSLREELDDFPDHSTYLSGLPAPLREVRTDAAGDFTIPVRPGNRYVLFVRTERRIAGETKDLRWFVQVSGSAVSPVLLGSHNLITREAPENVIHLSAGSPESET